MSTSSPVISQPLSGRWRRIATALARSGVEVRRHDGLLSFRSPTAQAEVLLPEGFPL